MINTLIWSFSVLVFLIVLGLSGIWLTWKYRRWRADHLYADIQSVSDQHNLQSN